MLAIFGILSGLLSIISNIPYVIDIYKRKTQPHRVTWGIFFLLNIIYLANHISAGATNSLWLIVGFTVSTFIIFILSLKRGVGGSEKLDIFVLISALVGVVLWQITDNPTISIFANALSGIFAAIPTLKKAYIKPESETKIKWFIGIFAGIFAAISVGRLELPLLVLPLLTIIIQGSMFLILTTRGKRN